MANRGGAESPSVPSRYDAICRVVYELCLVIGPTLYLLVAIHGALTQRFNLSGTPDSQHVEVLENRRGTFQVGCDYPIYRFEEKFTEPMVYARAIREVGNKVTFLVDPSKSKVAIGRQGIVLANDQNLFRINLGLRNGIVAGANLSVFDARSRVGIFQVIQSDPSESKGILLDAGRTISPKDLVGKTVSEYTVVTQMDVEPSPAASIFDLFFFTSVLSGYFFLWWKYGGPPLSTIGPRVMGRVHISPSLRLTGLVIASIPACYYLTDFSIRAVGYLTTAIYTKLSSAPVPTWMHYETFHYALWPLFILVLGAFHAYLWLRRASPFRWFAERIAFRGGVFGHAASDLAEHITIWFLELIIVYVFARMLFSFVLGNTAISIRYCWPKAPAFQLSSVSPFSERGFTQMGKAISYMVTHAPNPGSVDAVFSSLELVVFSACILGALLGYGYAMVSYLWGNRIRNVDFSVVGWVTNAVCYAPLLGLALWTMVPELVGSDPTITVNPLHGIILCAGLILNVIYTWTIWNLGVKFGVMTDKGVRRTGFYSVVRHPSYTVEGIMFVMIACIGFSTIYQWYAGCWYFAMFLFRSEREDQFMTVSNPEYVEYKKQVPYKFIPGVW